MNKVLGILIGLLILLVPVYTWITNYRLMGDAALVFLKGGLVWFFILIGAFMVLSGLLSLKD